MTVDSSSGDKSWAAEVVEAVGLRRFAENGAAVNGCNAYCRSTASCPANLGPSDAMAAKQQLRRSEEDEDDMAGQMVRAESDGGCTTSCRVQEVKHVEISYTSEGGKMVNQFARIRRLGLGSYSKVVLYRDTITNCHVAIKVCSKSRLRRIRVAPQETALSDVMREVAIMKRLHHPNIIQLLQVIDDPAADKIYLVMEYAEGGSLEERRKPNRGMGEEEARQLFVDALSGLMYLHSKNIIHGDIKPENLLLSSDGRVKLCDFGLSQQMQGEDDDEVRRSPGTAVFTAPECCTGEGYSGRAADIWALGCTLFIMVSGEYPFLGDSALSTYGKIQHEELVIPTSLSADLSELLQLLLMKDPRRRISLQEAAIHPWIRIK